MENEVEIIISDNASTDNTYEIVKNANKCKNFSYYKNEHNLGMDGNFYACYRYAKGRFLWVFSDDDLLRPNSLSLVLDLLKSNLKCGVCYMDSDWFEKFDVSQIYSVSNLDYEVYGSSLAFLKKINYWTTFLTGNIVNKELIDGKVHPEENMGTMLVQLSWVIPAIFSSSINIFVKTKIILCKSDNTGGYKIFEVFGKNLNKVLDSLIKRGCDKKIKSIINNHLLTGFFPGFLNKENASFLKEDYMLSLLPVFWKYKKFWTIIFPIFLKQKLRA